MRTGVILAVIFLAFLFLWKCNYQPSEKVVGISSPTASSDAVAGASPEGEAQGSKIDPVRTDISNTIPEELLSKIRNEFAAIFPHRYAGNLGSFLENQEERLSTLVNEGKALPLDKFWRNRKQLLGVVPLLHQEELESCNLFQMDHMQLLLTGQNRSFTWFEKRSPEHWLLFPIEKLKGNSFQYPPDVIYAYLDRATSFL